MIAATGDHPNHIGLDTHTEIDAHGKNIGDAILAAAKPGGISGVGYCAD